MGSCLKKFYKTLLFIEVSPGLTPNFFQKTLILIKMLKKIKPF